MRSALNNGQVDAIWTPEPFLSQALNLDGARIVMAPGPVLGKLLPERRLRARSSDWATKNPGLAKQFRTAINQSLRYAQTHPDEIRALLPAARRTSGCRSGARSIDRTQLLHAREVREEVRRHLDAAELHAALPAGREDRQARR